MQHMQLQYLEHAEDILSFTLRCQAGGKACALGIITDVTGGSARDVGSIFAVSETGEMAGYVSNGCVDEDLKLQAMDTIEKGSSRQLIYGVGSLFIDLQLPCGGTIKIEIDPSPNPNFCLKALEMLQKRMPVRLTFSSRVGLIDVGGNTLDPGWYGDHFHAIHIPRMQLMIAGSGAPTTAVTNIATAMKLPFVLMSPSVDDRAFIPQSEHTSFYHLKSQSSLPDIAIDDWSAVLLLFHAHEWEHSILLHALRFNPFYIGALGSPKTHKVRIQTLMSSNIEAQGLDRIHGPIGVIPSARDAHTLAISVLAEIIASYRRISRSTVQSMHDVMTVAG